MRKLIFSLSLLLALGVQVFGQERPGGGGSGGTANGVSTIAQTNLTLFPTQTNSYQITGSIWGNFIVTNNTILQAVPTNSGVLIYTGINTNGKVAYMCFNDPTVINDSVFNTWSLTTNYPAVEGDNNVYGLVPISGSVANVPLGAYTNGLGLGGQASYGYSVWQFNINSAPSPVFGFRVYGLDYTPRSSPTNLPVPLTQLTTTNGGTLEVRTTSSYYPTANNGQVEVAFLDAVDNYPYVVFNYDNFSNGSREGFLNFVGQATAPYGEIGGFQGFMSKLPTPLADNGSIVFDARDPVGGGINDAGSFITLHGRASQSPANPDATGIYNLFTLVDNYGRMALAYPYGDPTSGATSNSLHFPFRVSIYATTNIPALGFAGSANSYQLGTATNGAIGFDGTNFQVSRATTWEQVVVVSAASKVPTAVTLTGSAFTFTNNTRNVLECYFSGGTAYSVTKNGAGIYGSLIGDGYFLLQPTNRCVVTYTVAPSFYTNAF